MASRKSSRATGGSPSPGSKRGERRCCGSEAVALRGRGGGSSGRRSQRREGRALPAVRGSRQGKRWDAAPSPTSVALPFPPLLPAPLVPPRRGGWGGDAGVDGRDVSLAIPPFPIQRVHVEEKVVGPRRRVPARKLPRRDEMSAGQASASVGTPRLLPPGDEVEPGCPNLTHSRIQTGMWNILGQNY